VTSLSLRRLWITFVMASAAFSVTLATLSAGCSLSRRPQSEPYTDPVKAYPASYAGRIQHLEVPTDEASRKEFCGGLRQDRARMVSGIREESHLHEAAAAVSPPGDVGTAGAALGESLQNIGVEMNNRELRQNVAAIDQKMVEAACNVSPMPAASSKRTGAQLEECVATCQKLTGRDTALCFNECAQ